MNRQTRRGNDEGKTSAPNERKGSTLTPLAEVVCLVTVLDKFSNPIRSSAWANPLLSVYTVHTGASKGTRTLPHQKQGRGFNSTSPAPPPAVRRIFYPDKGVEVVSLTDNCPETS
ncbi:hypothetical protein SARC_11369 [Sphaeroforma arctica JP610]|uniref:Uncharacterized protein n=1 Tax=Sphaeroforma arctica JP610 TaxID=667725 RepID=A0A0L0FH70_9EUKA|nr:hypothetical protein SARC_11369 [Sphaeroforma arctica JP610]KNC76119.1 hypothetical protein SARC_11369 [Sphaeroforma arctica JP610]|eukprot:XP_014150021.1 hypothetical protein SARC_11369 [Sphaeroforma arctica JP610]